MDYMAPDQDDGKRILILILWA